MSSLTRNTRGAHTARRSWAIGAVLALTLASGAALAGGAHPFVFTAYTDGAGGADILAGRYRAALDELKRARGAMESNPSSTSTNRCVAYAMSMQWQEARAACDDAVREAREEEPDLDYLAVAYANRAVLDWLSQDDAAAQKDLVKAQALSPSAGFVAKNVAALKIHRAVALAAAAARKS